MNSAAGRRLSGRDSSIFATGNAAATSRLVGTALRAATQFLFARWIGAAQFGLFVTYRGWTELIARLPNRGYQSVTRRYVPVYLAEGRSTATRQLLRTAATTTAKGTVVVSIIAAVVGVVLGATPWTAWLVAVATIPGWAAVRLGQSALDAQHQTVIAAFAAEFLQPVAFLAIAWGLLTFTELSDLHALLITLTASLFLAAALMWRSIVRVRPSDSHADPGAIDAETTTWDQDAKPLFGAQLAVNVLSSADLLVLAAVAGTSATAVYALATRMATTVRLVTGAYEAVAGPRIAADWQEHGAAGVQRWVDRSIRISLPISILVAAGLLVVSVPLFSWVGDDMPNGTSLVALLAVGHIVTVSTGPAGAVLVAVDAHRLLFLQMAGAAFALVVIGVAFGALWGAVGVAVGRTVVDAGRNLAIARTINKRFDIRCFPTASGLRG